MSEGNNGEEMPGGITMAVHYGSVGAFRKGQARMARNGWELEGFDFVGEPGGLFGRRQAVEAHYLRDAWPTE
jgi:hypothetical protein